jgi:hypothetical protein
MPVKRRASKHLVHRITPPAVEAYSAGDYGALHLALKLPPFAPSPLPLAVTPLGVDADGAVGTWPRAADVTLAQELALQLAEACETRGLPQPSPRDDGGQ